MMSRREELEKELKVAQEEINNAPKDIPKVLLDALREQYDSISFELNNLYDDEETETK